MAAIWGRRSETRQSFATLRINRKERRDRKEMPYSSFVFAFFAFFAVKLIMQPPAESGPLFGAAAG
jgi:hypothetical protein